MTTWTNPLLEAELSHCDSAGYFASQEEAAQALEDADRMNFNMRTFGTIDAPRIPDAALLELCDTSQPCEVVRHAVTHAAPQPRYVIVECGRDEEVLLRDSWERGTPVEIGGVLFEMAVIARQRTWWRPALVRGIRKG